MQRQPLVRHIVMCLALFALATGSSTQTFAQSQTQSEVIPGVVLLQLKSGSNQAVSDAFTATRPADDPHFAHSDIHAATLADASALSALLGLPARDGKGLRLRPYLPTHSIAFEEIRERSNPELFRRALSINTGSAKLEALREAEGKLARWFVLEFDPHTSSSAVLHLLAKAKSVERAEPKYRRFPCYVPNDPQVPNQYALPLIHAFEAWDVVRCDSTMLVADVDLGTDWTHEDLARSIYTNMGEVGVDDQGNDKRANGIDDDGNGYVDDWHGWDFDGADGNTPDNDTRTPQSHGTHTAGIIGATGDNNIGIAGVAFGCRILPIKASDNSGASLDFGFEGVAYAADMHAKIVSCSWGGPTRAQAEQDVIDYTYAKDCAIVAAAGNNGLFLDFYPASYVHVLSVTALEPSGNIDPNYANFSRHVSVSAPGTQVLSTVAPNSYQALTGTSMACPNAAGGLALVRKHFPQYGIDQAVQQIRATSDAIYIDSAHLDLIGHGRINLKRAVSDTTQFSARIHGYRIADDFNTGQFTAGSSGGIIVRVVNYLRPVTALIAHATVVEGADAIDLRNDVVYFGAAGTLDTVENLRVGFFLSVHDSVQPNTVVTIKLAFSDSAAGYTRDVDYFSFIINPAYLDLNRNNLTVTVSSKGSLGYNDVVTNSQGDGFAWTHPPSGILARAKSVLYQAGLIVATDIDHMADVVQNNSDIGADNDFVPTEVIHNVTPDRLGAVQELHCAYKDSIQNGPQVGTLVDQSTYAYASGLAANTAVIRYVFRKNPNSSVAASDNTAIAMFMDWDIGLSGALNVTRFDSVTGIASMNRLELGYPVVGVKLISPLPMGASINYHAVQNDGSEGDINTYDGFSRDEKLTAITEPFLGAGRGDVSFSYGITNAPLASQDSVELVIVYALASNEAELPRTIDEATKAYYAKASAGQAAASERGITTYPSPFSKSLNIEWQSSESDEPATVTVFDALGRSIITRSTRGNHLTIDDLQLAAGLYFVDIVQGSEHWTKQVLSVQ